jgi:hypothetical protein
MNASSHQLREELMGVHKGPSEGGSGGRRGHSSKEAWGCHDEVKEQARLRRRLDDKSLVRKEPDDPTPDVADDHARSPTADDS